MNQQDRDTFAFFAPSEKRKKKTPKEKKPKPQKANAAYFRAAARANLGKNFLTMVLIAFVASLLGGFSLGSVMGLLPRITVSKESLHAAIPSADALLTLLVNGEFGEALAQHPAIASLLGMLAAIVGGMLLISLFVGSAVELSYQRMQLGLVDGETPTVKGLFVCFKKAYGKAVLARVLFWLLKIVIYLPAVLCACWVGSSLVEMIYYARLGNEAMVDGAIDSVLLSSIVTGCVVLVVTVINLIVSLRLAFVTVILAEYPELGVIGAFRNSISLTKGKAWRLFCLRFSFIGWMILSSIAPYGLGTYILMPYQHAADVAFYHEVANRGAAEETEFPSLDPADYDPEEARW